MTNLDRLADSDLLIQGFSEFVRNWFARRRAAGLKLSQEIAPLEDAGEAPESLRQFYALWQELPGSNLGTSLGMIPWERMPGGFLRFADAITNWEFGVRHNSAAAETDLNQGWEVWAYSKNSEDWRPLAGVRLDHLLVEAGLISLFSLPNSLRIFGEDGTASERWEAIRSRATPIWTGRFCKEQGIYNFDYTFRSFEWVPAGALLQTEAREFGLAIDEKSLPTIPFRYATFCNGAVYDQFKLLPRARRNDTGFLSQPVE